MENLKKVNVLGVGITNASEEGILEYIARGLQIFTKKYYIVTPNPELLVLAGRNREYKSILNGAKIALPDGVGVLIAGQLLGSPLKQRITGVDFVKSLSKYVAKRPITVGFLGAGPNVAVKTAECLKNLYPELKVGLAREDWKNGQNLKPVDVLFVALGSPKQELFIYKNLQSLPGRVIIGVGGAFDFISGKIPRAPKILQDLGLEWLFRLVIQPWRIKRQMSLVRFLYLIFKEKLGLHH